MTFKALCQCSVPTSHLPKSLCIGSSHGCPNGAPQLWYRNNLVRYSQGLQYLLCAHHVSLSLCHLNYTAWIHHTHYLCHSEFFLKKRNSLPREKSTFRSTLPISCYRRLQSLFLTNKAHVGISAGSWIPAGRRLCAHGWIKRWGLQRALHCGNQNSTIYGRTRESHFRQRGSFRPQCTTTTYRLGSWDGRWICSAIGTPVVQV